MGTSLRHRIGMVVSQMPLMVVTVGLRVRMALSDRGD